MDGVVDTDVCDTARYTGWLDAGVSRYASGDCGREEVGVIDENNESCGGS